MALDRSEWQGKSAEAENSNWLAEIFDRSERTAGGYAIGVVRDLLDRGSTAEVLRERRARANDEIAHIAADTVAFLPSLKWTAGGALRALVLIDPQGGTGNAGAFAKNFLEGAALNKVGKLALPEGAFGKALASRLGSGLAAESLTHLTVGLGMGAVKAGFNQNSWFDAEGRFSALRGAEAVVTAGGLGGLVNLPAGMLGVRVSRAATVAFGEGAISARSAALISGMGSGYAGGVVFGGVDALMQGKTFGETLSEMHRGGLVGAVTGGFVHGYESGRLSRLAGSSGLGSEQRVSAQVEKGAARQVRENAELDAEISPKLWENDSIDIVFERPAFKDLLANGRRLINPTRVVEKSILPVEGAEGPFADRKAFEKTATREEKVRFVRYDVAGHSARLYIPEAYARSLDEVRQLRLFIENPENQAYKSSSDVKEYKEIGERLLGHPLKDRALPEDFIPLLDQLPDRSLVRRLYILDSRNPEDGWQRQTYKPDFRSAASANADGEITFYQQERSQWLRDHTFHEWAHLVKFKHEQKSVHFDLAAAFEKDGYFASEYARKDNHENFAVHFGEEFLHYDADTFASLASRAPVRTAIFAQALVEVMGKTPDWARSPHHRQWAERVKVVEDVVLPAAQERLLTALKGGDLANKKLAAQLLGPLGGKEHLEPLIELAKKSGNAELSEMALDAALQIARTDRARLDVLVAAGGPGSSVRDIAVYYAARLRDPRAPQYWRLLDWAGKPEHTHDLIGLIATMPDQKGKTLAFEAAWSMVRSRGSLGTMSELLRSAPDAATREMVFRGMSAKLEGMPEKRASLAVHMLEREPSLRLPALETLNALAIPFTEPYIRPFMRNRDARVSELATLVIEKIQLNEKLSVLTARSRGGSTATKVEAVRGLGETGDMRSVQPLLEALATGTDAVRGEAAQALKRFSSTIVKFEARELARKRPDLRPAMRRVIEGPFS